MTTAWAGLLKILLLEAVDAAVVARPPASQFTVGPSRDERKAKRHEQRDTATSLVGRYNPDAGVVVGPPSGQDPTAVDRPYGGLMTIDGDARRAFADYA